MDRALRWDRWLILDGEIKRFWLRTVIEDDSSQGLAQTVKCNQAKQLIKLQATGVMQV